jgi:hypothetical protein
MAVSITPFGIEKTLNSGPRNESLIADLYAARESVVQSLKEKGVVTVQDLSELDRLGRSQVADELWEISTKEVKLALLSDDHHQVRSVSKIN